MPSVDELCAPEPGVMKLTFPALRPLLAKLRSPKDGKPTVFAFVARKSERAVGMILGTLSHDLDAVAKIQSLYVIPPLRHQGLGNSLWREAESFAVKNGAKSLVVNYIAGKPGIQALEKLIARNGWSQPELSMLVVKMHYEPATKAPWFRKWKLPETDSIADWDDLSAEQLNELDSQRGPDSWIAEDLDPRLFLKDHHPGTSLALLREEKIRGWIINHQLEDKLRFSCSFVHPDLQRKGRVFALYSEAVRRCPEFGILSGIWTIPTKHPAMQNFARRWMLPYSYEFTESRTASKALV